MGDTKDKGIDKPPKDGRWDWTRIYWKVGATVTFHTHRQKGFTRESYKGIVRAHRRARSGRMFYSLKLNGRTKRFGEFVVIVEATLEDLIGPCVLMGGTLVARKEDA